MIGPTPVHDQPPLPIGLYWFGRAVLWVFGWDVQGEVPSGGKAVVIGAPHTSNWDFVFFLAAAFAFRLRVSWVGKHTLFRGPLGWFLRATGGLPVDRRAAHGLVGGTVQRFQEADRLFLMIPAEGTRSWSPYWKSGFYHIAREADVPIIPGYLDYARKVACLGPAFRPTGDLRADMDRLRDFYRDIQARYPEHRGPIRLREEDGTPAPPPSDRR